MHAIEKGPKMIKSLTWFYGRFFVEIYSVLFIILGIFGVLHHDLWRDELQAWLIARYSHSIPELLYNLRYESHPPLWYFLLFWFKNITSNPKSMQFLHLGLASINAWLVLKFAPFSRLQKVFLIFGWFLFYEFALISRSYVLGVFFIFLFCILARQQKRDYLLLALVLILLNFTSILGLILAVAFAAFLVLEAIQMPVLLEHKRPQALVALFLLISAVFTGLIIMNPLPDSGWIKGLISWPGPRPFFKSLILAYFPYWGSIRMISVSLLQFSYLFFFLSFFFFYRKGSVLFLYAIGVLGLVLFFSMINNLFSRHMGHLFILLVACWWICPQIPSWANRLITVVLFIQLAVGLGAYKSNLNLTFSDGKDAAIYIKMHKLDQLPIIVAGSGGVPISGYLNKPVFYLVRERWGTFYIYDNKAAEFSSQQMLDQAQRISRQFKKDAVLALSHPLENSLLSPSVQKLDSFTKGQLQDEHYYLYLFKGIH